MNRQEFRENIMALDVWDTHTHLNMPGVPIPAPDFWEIGHYFWFLRELQAAGYPKNYRDLPENERAEAYIKAFDATRNTAMNWVVRHIFKNLHGLEITDVDSIHRANEAVKASFQRPDWCRSVIDRLAIRRILVNSMENADYPQLPGVGGALPGNAGIPMREAVERILSAEDQAAEARLVETELDRAVDKLAAQGIGGVRAMPEPFDTTPTACDMEAGLAPKGNTAEDVQAFMGHALLRAISRHGMFAQYFIGVEKGVPVSESRRVNNMHGLFARYPKANFELVIGTPVNNMDAIQAARIFTNVYVGGMWWYNFRVSTYRESMQQRFEALPSSKCSLVVSDARCIEWCYGKILLIKRLLSDFLADKIEEGWVDEATALAVAKNWLYNTPARLNGEDPV